MEFTGDDGDGAGFVWRDHGGERTKAGAVGVEAQLLSLQFHDVKGGITGKAVEQVDGVAGDRDVIGLSGRGDGVGPFEFAGVGEFGDGLFVDGEVAVGA